MATIQQIEANRRNAERSTGPRSVEGKAVSRFNAIKTGIDAKSQIIRGEDPVELETLTAEYQERWQPATPGQRLLVDTLINCEWLLRRFRKSEAQLWQCKMQEVEVWQPEQECNLGQAFSRGCDEFSRLQRRIDSTNRNYHRALKELQHLESDRRESERAPDPSPAASPQPVPIQPSTVELGSFRNFASEDAPDTASSTATPPNNLIRPFPAAVQPSPASIS